MDLSKNTQIDLLYLTNPNFKLKYNKQIKELVNEEDLKFYRKRVLQETKDMLRGNRITTVIDNAFENFVNELIKHYKFIDKKQIIQNEYKDLPEKKSKQKENFDLSVNNELIMNKPEPIKKTIKDFIPIVVKERKPNWGKLHFGERNLAKDLINSEIINSNVIEGTLVEILRADELINFLNERNSKGYPYFWVKKHLK